ncbi:bifunctional pyr operon transcriptional regulator/uracil phosphoribosyltransferase PyrR [Zongyangia hominis]|uniref:Bifunctional protein PyrR n=1 Tax=Zongyangia hominis TaxID=2763677 RepID=A0A926ICD4_9FIRM|nr:bifunctional pyr operon transcriptional regulator/uracil phosphoribosyltransferase PyrR [Zongyangia hominis]MBC8571005.1 bifunctional pyr operon transcriptional regulator/uracil phosphoribosyltransferase PyrR [Zongyangia hominis]
MLIEKAQIMDEKAMARAMARITYEIIERNHGVENVCILGLKSRGGEIARRIADKIQEIEGRSIPVGMLDITPFRDDIPKDAQIEDTSSIPFDVTGRKIVLVDDVMYTGRSTRAALDAVMARGRPEAVQLAVLIDRGHRELPLRPDFIGKNVPTSRNEEIRVMMRERDGVDKVSIYVKKEEAR